MWCEYARLCVCKRRTLVYSANVIVCNRVNSLGLTLFVYELKQGTHMFDCFWYCLWTAPWLKTSMLLVKIGVWSSSSTYLFGNVSIIHTLHITASEVFSVEWAKQKSRTTGGMLWMKKTEHTDVLMRLRLSKYYVPYTRQRIRIRIAIQDNEYACVFINTGHVLGIKVENRN